MLPKTDVFIRIRQFMDANKLDEAISLCLSSDNDELTKEIIDTAGENRVGTKNDYFQKSSEIHYELGSMLYESQRLFESLEEYRVALRFNPTNYNAFECLESIKSRIMDRWHIRMINDCTRNSRYHDAIKAAILSLGHDNVSVLDIGGGTGLLSIISMITGAKKVYCCELNADLSLIASQLTSSWRDVIQIIPKHSNNVIIGIDIPDKVDLIVSEIFDCGLFGEGCLESFNHAVVNLLKPNGLVIPFSARIFLSAIESDYIKSMDLISWPSALACGDVSFVGNELSHEPYLCVNLKQIQFRQLSNVVELNCISLVDLTELNISKSLSVLSCGRLDGLAVWFELNLFHDITVLTSPFDREFNAWDQAVFCTRHTHGTLNDIQLTIGESIQVKATIIDFCKLQLTCNSLQMIDSTSVYSLGEDLMNFINTCQLFEFEMIRLLQSIDSSSSVLLIDNCDSILPIYVKLACNATVVNYSSDLLLTDFTCDVIIANIIDPASGMISSGVLNDLWSCGMIMSGLVRIVPQSIIIKACAIHCSELWNEFKFNANEYINIDQLKKLEPVLLQSVDLDCYRSNIFLSEEEQVACIDLMKLNQANSVASCSLPLLSMPSKCHGVCINLYLNINNIQVKASNYSLIYLSKAELQLTNCLAFSLCIDYKNGFYVFNMN